MIECTRRSRGRVWSFKNYNVVFVLDLQMSLLRRVKLVSIQIPLSVSSLCVITCDRDTTYKNLETVPRCDGTTLPSIQELSCFASQQHTPDTWHNRRQNHISPGAPDELHGRHFPSNYSGATAIAAELSRQEVDGERRARDSVFQGVDGE